MLATTPRRKLPQPLLLAACLLLEACTTLGPDFVRPEVPWLARWSSSALRSDPAEGQKRERAATEEWWRNFKDPALDLLVAEAQQRNTDVRTAGLRILEARAQLGIARSTLYPQLQQLTGEALRAGRQQSNGPDTAVWSYGVGLDIAWELDFWSTAMRTCLFVGVACYAWGTILLLERWRAARLLAVEPKPASEERLA